MKIVHEKNKKFLNQNFQIGLSNLDFSIRKLATNLTLAIPLKTVQIMRNDLQLGNFSNEEANPIQRNHLWSNVSIEWTVMVVLNDKSMRDADNKI